MNPRILPPSLTNYDLLKTAALLLIVADHIGAFFYADILWLKVLGRLSIPVWFFLAGHARSRSETVPLLIGGILLTVGAIVSGQTLFPLNVLFTILAVRVLCGPLMRPMLSHYMLFWPVCLLLVALLPSSYAIMDYGTIGLLFAFFGYMTRQGSAHPLMMFVYALFCAAVYTASQVGIFPFTHAQIAVIAAGTFFILAMLGRFKPVQYTTQGLVAGVFKFTGRHTLIFYVVHLLAIEVIAMILMPDAFNIGNWRLNYFPLPFVTGS